MIDTGLSRHEHWRSWYRLNRYAETLSEEELHSRFRDIFLNMMSLGKNGLIGPPDIGLSSSHELLEKFTHILEEYVIRYGPFPNGLNRQTLHSRPPPDFTSSLGSRACAAINANKLNYDQVLVKYGKRIHIESLREHGAIFLRRASYYAESSHNDATQDDELSLKVTPFFSQEAKDALAAHFGLNTPATGRFDFTWNHHGDYLLFCLCKEVDPRMFIDFNADACLVITDLQEFDSRIKTARVTQCDATFRKNHVVYVDPLLPQISKVDVPFYKHFRYSYQKEYRYVWQPSHGNGLLNDELVKIGPLTDISYILYAD